MQNDNAWLPDDLLAQVDALNGHGGELARALRSLAAHRSDALCGNSVAGFSGLTDLAIVLAIFGAFVYLVYRVARKIFIEST